MNFKFIEQLDQKELEQFKTVCNKLLSRTFIVRTVYNQAKVRINNPDYNFINTHFEEIRDYLSLLDFGLHKEDYNGYFYILNTNEINRCNLNKTETAIVIALRIIYEERQDNIGLENDIICTVSDILEKVAIDYPILSNKPSMKEVKQALTLLENHSIIQRIEGHFSKPSCTFAILPTILTVVSDERLNTVVTELKKEDNDIEEAEEDITY